MENIYIDAILVGSYALNHYTKTNYNDIDFMIKSTEYEKLKNIFVKKYIEYKESTKRFFPCKLITFYEKINGNKIKIEIMVIPDENDKMNNDYSNNQIMLYNIVKNYNMIIIDYVYLSMFTIRAIITPIEVMYAMLISHINFSKRFEKHANSLIILKKLNADKKIDDILNQFIKKRMEIMKKRYTI